MAKPRTIVFCLCLFLQFHYAGKRVSWAAQQRESFNAIDQNKAIGIANRHARKTYKTLKRFRVVACEGLVHWRIIYDGGGPEYVIDKRTGIIIKVEHIPQSPRSNGGALARQNKSISEQEAIEIAKEDARLEYGDKEDVDKYEIHACEQARVWRIVFDFKPPSGSRNGQLVLPHGSFPQYVIDKASGKIIYRARD